MDHAYDLERLGNLAGALSSRCGEYLSRMGVDGYLPDETPELLLAVQAHLAQVYAALCLPQEVEL